MLHKRLDLLASSLPGLSRSHHASVMPIAFVSLITGVVPVIYRAVFSLHFSKPLIAGTLPGGQVAG